MVPHQVNTLTQPATVAIPTITIVWAGKRLTNLSRQLCDSTVGAWVAQLLDKPLNGIFRQLNWVKKIYFGINKTSTLKEYVTKIYISWLWGEIKVLEKNIPEFCNPFWIKCNQMRLRPLLMVQNPNFGSFKVIHATPAEKQKNKNMIYCTATNACCGQA